jgi:type IV secretory pathway TraG/TraD family ATPase VirD4
MTIALRHRTTRTRTLQGLYEFYLARDRFLHEQIRRRGLGIPFATYAAPDDVQVSCCLTPEDLRQHTLVLGATGCGKSSLLERMVLAHFHRQQGLALIDLHGDLFVRTAAVAEARAIRGTTFLDFTRPETLPAWNPLAELPGVESSRQVDLLVGVLKRLYASETAASWAWGVKVEEIMRATLRALIESSVLATLVDVRAFLLIPTVRRDILATTTPETQHYFAHRFGAREEMYVSAVLNKLDPFLGSLAVQRFFGRPVSTFDLFAAVDRGETVLVNLARGHLGPTADVLGRFLVNALQLAALRRERMPIEKREPFSIILDEAHNLAAPESGLEDLLVAARKYRVYLTLAAQSLSLFPPRFRPHLLGNTARQFFFRMPFVEARVLAPEIFEPLGTIRREPVRPYDDLSDPLLTPSEEVVARTRELANLPVGACYWLLKGRRYKARRIQVRRPTSQPRRHDSQS